MTGFRHRLQMAIDNSPYRGLPQKLSVDAGLGRKTVYNMLRDDRLDHSQNGPGLFGMARIAALLEVPLDFFAPTKPTKIRRLQPSEPRELTEHVTKALGSQALTGDSALSADALLRAHTKSGGRVEAFSSWIERCDQYEPPASDARGLRVLRVGERSLAAITMGTNAVEVLQSALDTVEAPEIKSQWLSDYRVAQSKGTFTTVESLDIQMPNLPVRVKMDFIRCLLSVTDVNKTRSILNFSLLII